MTATSLEAFLGALADDDPETLYDQAPCGYLTTTPDGLIAKVNETFLTLTGYDRGRSGRTAPARRPAHGGRTDLSRDALRPPAADA